MKEQELTIEKNQDFELKDIFERAMDQNFVPVIDDGNHFIGIITRKKILNHFKDKIS